MPMNGREATHAYAAVDLGAETGRVLVGQICEGAIQLDEVHRFSNRPVRLPDGLCWNLPQLFADSLRGLRIARSRAGALTGVGVDGWGVDYGLLDSRGRLLGLPFHYRDERTLGMQNRAYERVSAERLYEATGIQAMQINTVFQLLAEEGSRALAGAERIAFVPDLLSYWLCGELANELTVSSTSGLLDARGGEWAEGLIDELGIPAGIFGQLVEPGTPLGPVLPHNELGATTAIATASHDTAAAFAAAPIQGETTAVLSSGTWSLLGLELREPLLGPAARDADLTNERGIDGTTRLLKNVMGLWLVQECRRSWLDQGRELSYEQMMRLAVEGADEIEEVPLFDPDRADLLAPGDMPARIEKICRETGQQTRTDIGAVVRSALVSLACKYRFVLELLESVSGRTIESVHTVGGGARNALLCQLTADVLGRTVSAGPGEASALGNVLVQARAIGEISSLAELREVAAASVAPRVFQPRADVDRGDRVYERFLRVTELISPTPPVCQGS